MIEHDGTWEKVQKKSHLTQLEKNNQKHNYRIIKLIPSSLQLPQRVSLAAQGTMLTQK